MKARMLFIIFLCFLCTFGWVSCGLLVKKKDRNIKGKLLAFKNIVKSTKSQVMRGGLSGAFAGVIQVVTLMWLRTTTNYQYQHGCSMTEALAALYKDGGLPRFYQGVSYALLQGPLARFGSVASNEIAKVVSQHFKGSKFGNIICTFLGAVLAAIWRIFLMPLDTLKTVQQVGGRHAYKILLEKVMVGNIGALYEGATATLLATIAGHYPWFLTHNLLDEIIRVPVSMAGVLFRNAFIGFASSVVSDVASNFIRVIKTMKQVSASENIEITYIDLILQVCKRDGVFSLFFRGLGSRIFTNGLQSILFTVVWKLIIHHQLQHSKKDEHQSLHSTHIVTAMRSGSDNNVQDNGIDENFKSERHSDHVDLEKYPISPTLPIKRGSKIFIY